ncbi:Succinate--CoA ligase ADP-forming subunit beta, mitochondrial [Hondaea fermentalgiana]|uniref:Succinate--CoA ligase [ADP-forming] subunit beta, mitochondrial n=1 Tax=Hondaea fermentalgiana TaxID=2315210 RepID=A0A2R5GSG7_9STRA|nr:Succinate--CoA ligase ADP-forming subunit beta, mitochondrial [Hondaea fermentalgiana]|eukprot:GBG32698.1 Succinate--CoA ligase ADP-forming subunit beta, mitochondrial [Hondaea fermentalgiana]
MSAMGGFSRAVTTVGRSARSAQLLRHTQTRKLNIHEYASMQVMKEYGVPTPKNSVATSAEEAQKVYDAGELGEDVVIKAQVLAGGRGRGTFKNGFEGGVQMVSKSEEAKDIASKMLGQLLVTKQTGEEGKPCERVLLMERLKLKRETYFSILLDRSHVGVTLVGSPAGGMSIEDVAAETPEKIFTEKVDIMSGLQEEQVDRLAKNLGYEGEAHGKAKKVIQSLYNLFIDCDCTLVEINPLAETESGDVFCCDAKLNFDDNAEFRQEKIFAFRDRNQEDKREVEASKYDLNYIGLDGTVGCMVNGAGLAMSTLDIVTLHGGSASNFLDLGGGATKDAVQKAFELLNDDDKVKSILVNIFGGIMRCDIIAEGMVAAAKEIGLEKPLVVRLKGTNVEKAREILGSSDVKLTMLDDLDEAAATAVKLAA